MSTNTKSRCRSPRCHSCPVLTGPPQGVPELPLRPARRQHTTCAPERGKANTCSEELSPSLQNRTGRNNAPAGAPTAYRCYPSTIKSFDVSKRTCPVARQCFKCTNKEELNSGPARNFFNSAHCSLRKIIEGFSPELKMAECAEPCRCGTISSDLQILSRNLKIHPAYRTKLTRKTPPIAKCRTDTNESGPSPSWREVTD